MKLITGINEIHDNALSRNSSKGNSSCLLKLKKIKETKIKFTGITIYYSSPSFGAALDNALIVNVLFYLLIQMVRDDELRPLETTD